MIPARVPLLLAAILLLSGCGGGSPSPSGPVLTQKTCDELVKNAHGTDANHTRVAFETSKGNFTAELFDDKTPITVANFKKLVADGFYTNMLFHRIIKDFMIQTGGMQTNGQFKESPYPAIKNEARSSGCHNTEYTLSMARTGGGPPDYGADTATNQFFVNAADNRASLDPGSYAQNPGGYAVFGVVYADRGVVDIIENTPVTYSGAPGANPHCQGGDSPQQPHCPKTDIVLRKIVVL